MPRILSSSSEASAWKKKGKKKGRKEKKWKDVRERERKIKAERWRKGEIYFPEALDGWTKLRQYLHIYPRSATPRTSQNDVGFFAAIPANIRRRTKQWKRFANGRKRYFDSIVLCMSRRNFRVKTAKPFRRPFLVSQFCENEAVPVTVFPHLHFAFVYTFLLFIFAPSLHSEARQKEEKHFVRTRYFSLCTLNM